MERGKPRASGRKFRREGADPQRASAFPRRLVGEGDGEDVSRRRLSKYKICHENVMAGSAGASRRQE